MSLSKFSADLRFTSDEGCEYESNFKVNPKQQDANKVLLDVIEHLAWMGVVGGQADETTKAFERGYAQGIERRSYLDSLKKESDDERSN